jgi:hypothetical protein
VPPSTTKIVGFSPCGCNGLAKAQGLKPEKMLISFGTAESRALIPAEAKASKIEGSADPVSECGIFGF